MNDVGDQLSIAIAVILVAFAGLLAATEAAMSRVSQTHAAKLQRDGRRGSDDLVRIASDPAGYLNLLLLLRKAAELGATCIVVLLTVRVMNDDGNVPIIVAASLMTVVSYIAVGVAPRTLGVQHSDTVGLRTAKMTTWLTRIFGPLPKLLIVIGNAITPGKGFASGPFATEAELRDLVDLAEQGQEIESAERQMIHSVFELGDTFAREVMVPRPDIVFIERDKTIKQALTLALRSGFSRIPVIGENADDILGVAYLKDLVRRTQEGKDQLDVVHAMRPATFVPDSKPVDELLREMQASQVHVAVVIDEYGGTAGLVTIEDILEEIVGEIADEYDRESPNVEQIDETTWRVTARLPIDEVNEMFTVDLPTEDADTVAGLMAMALGRVPIPGATVTLQGLNFMAESAKGRRNRIGTILIHREEDYGSDD
ncbi:MAG TPA: hemolysin family protein [Mycobacteriales bacterium]|nr:hemolysin family protein [Mycobacteriales bacterium]